MECCTSLSFGESANRRAFAEGIRDGLPIGLGYLTVGFSLGIAAKNAGLSVFQSVLVSALCNASAGEYAGFTVIAAASAYWEIILVTLIANARYLLMGCALSARMLPSMPMRHRLGVAFDTTDEIFGISISRPDGFNLWYTYGVILAAWPCWAAGTGLGALAGNLMPLRLVSAFSVALYGMFIAVIIPEARKNTVVRAIVLAGFALSWLASRLPMLSGFSEGTRVIVLTVLLSAAAAWLFPRKAAGHAA